MAVANPNTSPRRIVLKDLGGYNGSGMDEVASGIFSPGHLIKRDSAGKYLKHATEGGFAELIFATEAVLNQGKSIDDAYAIGDVVFYHVGLPGEVIFAYLKGGVNYAVGDTLMSDGAGCLKKTGSPSTTTVTAKECIAVVETALNLSASAAVPAARSAVRIV